jgi:hypothetical protein
MDREQRAALRYLPILVCLIIACVSEPLVKAEGSNAANYASTNEPVVVPPISFIDVNSGHFGKLEIDLENGQFLDTAVDKLHLTAREFDVQPGTLRSLNVSVQGGHLHDFIFDKLTMNTAENLKFDPGVLLNHRLLEFTEPAQADVVVLVSQKSLNQFLSSPKTLERLSVCATRKAGAIASLASLVGIKINQFGLTIDSASLKLMHHNQFKLDFVSKVGLGDLGLPISGTMQGQLSLQDGSLTITEPHLITAGQEIPPELSNFLIKKINLIPANTQKSNDIRFNFTDMKVTAGKQILLRGTASVSRLRFGNAGRG